MAEPITPHTGEAALKSVRQSVKSFVDARNGLRLAREAVEYALTAAVASATTVSELRALTKELPPGFGRFVPLFTKILTIEESAPTFGIAEGRTVEQLHYELFTVYEAYPEYHDTGSGSGLFEDMVQRFANDNFYRLHKVALRYQELKCQVTP